MKQAYYKVGKVKAHEMALPLGSLIHRVLVFLLIITSLTLIVMQRNDNALVQNLRMALTDTLTPVVNVMAEPMRAIGDARNWANDALYTFSENRILRAENAQLLHWQTVARNLEAENRALRSLMSFSPTKAMSFTTAKVLSHAGGAYSHSIVIGAGTEQGLTPNMAVVNEVGLVGRVIEVGDHTARVLLLRDINSRIPAITSQSRERSIVSGANRSALQLNYLSRQHSIAPGEAVVSSGDGEAFPAGLHIGTVQHQNGHLSVIPAADWDALEYVRVVHYNAPSKP
ncbi:MAG: rod shape-determining protein MreC [Rickettsiales bacterium]|nr:rod shape-determining protein MreC [Rickettsiales bacterium]